MPRPLIGLNADFDADAGRPRVRVNATYVDAVVRSGGVPVVLAPFDEAGAAEVDRLLGPLSGFVFTGGDDYDPASYGEARGVETECMDPRRDRFDRLLAGRVLASGMPLLGICGGLQLVNIVRGGSLRQHVPGHRDPERRDDVRHPVAVEPGSLLSRVLRGAGALDVNSWHHQATGRPGDGLVVTARAPGDDVVEALEDPRYPFLLLVQWHPERLAAVRPDMAGTFDALVAAARGA